MEDERDIESIIAMLIMTILVVWLLLGCCPCRSLTTSSLDSVRVDVVERVVELRDTVFFEVERDSQVIVTEDTTSMLENEYAISHASVVRGGLHHSLATKPRLWEMPVSLPAVRRDSIIYHNSYRTVEVEVERDRSWWEQTQINGFWAMLAFIAVILILRKIKGLIS